MAHRICYMLSGTMLPFVYAAAVVEDDTSLAVMCVCSALFYVSGYILETKASQR